MGNNSSQKNELYGRQSLNALPYDDIAVMRYANGSTITAGRLNNTFAQLVDNDKVIEYQLAHMSSYSVGPKAYDEAAIYAGEDGYKTWKNDDDDQLSILRKIDKPLQDSIVPVDGIDCAAYGVVQAAGKIFACTGCGLFASDDGKTFELSSPQCFYSAFSDSNYTFFAGENGLYQLNSEEYSVEDESGTVVKTRYFINRRNKTELSGCRAVFVRDGSKKIYVGANDGIYIGELTKNSLCADIEFQKQNLVSGDSVIQAQVNCIQKIAQNDEIADDSLDIVLGTSSGLYQSQEIDGVTGRSTSLVGKQVKSAVEFDGSLYALAEDGLYGVKNGKAVVGLENPACALSVGSSLYIGHAGGITKYSPYSQDYTKEITVGGEAVQQLFLIRPIDGATASAVDTIVGRLAGGRLFTVAPGTDSVQFAFGSALSGIAVAYANAQNKLYAVCSSDAETLSVFGVGSCRQEFLDEYGSLSAYSLTGENIVAYVRPYGDERPVDMFICATDTEVKDLQSGRNVICENVQKFARLVSADDSVTYGMIDSGKFRAFDAELVELEQDEPASASDMTDTQRLIAVLSGEIVSFASKSDESFSYINLGIEPSDVISCLQSDGKNVYFLDGSALSAAQEIPGLVQSQALSDIMLYDIVEAPEFSSVIAVTGSGIEFHQLSSQEGQEQLCDQVSSFAGTVHRCELKGLDTVVAYCSDGVSSFQLSTDDSGRLTVSAYADLAYERLSGVDTYDVKSVAVGSGFSFDAAASGLSVTHSQFSKAFSTETVSRGYPLFKSVYAVQTDSGLAFYRESEKRFEQTVAAIDMAEYIPGAGHISAYFCDGAGLSVIEVLNDSSYDYAGDISSVPCGISPSFLSPRVKYEDGVSSTIGMFVSDTSAVYDLGSYDEPTCEFGSIQSLANCVDDDRTLVFAVDEGTLRSYDCALGEYTTYSAISGIQQIAVDEYSSDDGVQHFTRLFVRQGENLYVLDPFEMVEDSGLGDSVATGVTDIRERTSCPHKVQAYSDSSRSVFEINGQTGAVEQKFSATEPLTMYDSENVYSTVSDVYLYGVKTVTWDSRKCVQVLPGASNEVMGTCYALFSDGTVVALQISKDSSVENIPCYTVMNGVKSLATVDGKICAVKDGNECCPDLGYPNVTHDFSAYDVTINSYVQPGELVRALFKTTEGETVFATSEGVYSTSSNQATLSKKALINLGGIENSFDFLKRTGGQVYAVSGPNLYSIGNLTVASVGTFPSDVQDVIKAGSVLYVKYSDSWYSDRLGTWTAEAYLDGYGVLDVIEGSDSAGAEFSAGGDTQLVATASGVFKTQKVKGFGLIVEPEPAKTYSFDSDISGIYGSFAALVPDVNVVVLSGGQVKYCAYDYSSGTVTEDIVRVKMSNGLERAASDAKYSSLFQAIYPVNEDSGSGETFAAFGSGTDLYAGTGQELEPYPDKRVTARDDIQVNSVSRYGGKCYICTSDGIFVSEGVGKEQQFKYIAAGDYDFRGSTEVSKERYLFASTAGLFTMMNRGHSLSQSVYKNEVKNDEALFVKSYAVGAGTTSTYAYASDNVVLTSDNAKKFEEFLVLPKQTASVGSSSAADAGDLSVFDMYAMNRNQYYFATSDGLYRTEYQFWLSNDIQKFTVEDAKAAYDGMQEELSARYEEYLEKHVSEYHSPADAVVSYVNDNLLSVSFDEIQNAGWQVKTHNATSSEMRVSNDMVYEIQFGDQTDGNVYVGLSNFLTSDANAECSYVFKRYMSGVSELYVYLPTTNTYYLNHLQGVPGCTKYSQEIKRPNLKGFDCDTFKTDMSQQYSVFQVNVDSTFVSVDTMLGVQVNGNSLPLKVYRDTTYSVDESDACLMYHSFVEPSKALTPVAAVSVGSDDEYHFKFACFGSDAQAVKISFYDAVNGMGTSTFKVEFHANGAEGSMAPQRFTIGAARKLRKCSFTWSGSQKMFAGWTTVTDPEDNTDPMYQDQELFSLGEGDINSGGTCHLYAVWMTYQFGENDTKLVLGSTKEEFFIDSATIITDTNLGDKVVVDYGD